MKNSVASKENTKIIKNKFGEIEVNLAKAIFCPYGLIGMPDQTSFTFVDCPIQKFSAFKLLQSLIKESMVFMVLPISFDNPIISIKDLEEAIEIADVNKEDAAFVLISSTKELDGRKVITVNARAPLIIDTKTQAAIQFVLPNAEYEVQHLI